MNKNGKISAFVAVSNVSERERIIEHIGKNPDVDVLGGCGSAEKVIDIHLRSRLDILFLDISLPPSGAFSLLRMWPGAGVPRVVFLAKSDEHALTAFQFHPLDFLLMPVDLCRLDETVSRLAADMRPRVNASAGNVVLDWLRNRTAAAIAAPGAAAAADPEREARPAQPATRLMLKNAGRINFLRTEEIDYVEAERDYVRIHNGGKKHLLREKISRLEQQLPADQFLRIHRSTIVNIDRIKEMQPLCYGEYSVILLDGTRLTLSRSFRQRVFSRLVSAA